MSIRGGGQPAPPHPSRLRRATFPPVGGRLAGAGLCPRPAGLLTKRRAVEDAGPYFTLQDLGMKSSPNCSTAYLSVMPDM